MLSHERYIPPRLQLVPHRFGSSTRHGTISELMTTSLQQVVSTKATCRWQFREFKTLTESNRASTLQ